MGPYEYESRFLESWYVYWVHFNSPWCISISKPNSSTFRIWNFILDFETGVVFIMFMFDPERKEATGLEP